MTSSNSYYPSNQIQKLYHISNSTLVRWAKSDQVEHIKLPGGKRLYSDTSIKKLLSIDNSNISTNRRKVLYCRVSSDHQKEDLKRQIDFLKTKFPTYEIISDVASGLNWHRRGFKNLLESVFDGDIEEIVVTYKDRFTRVTTIKL